MKTPVEHFLDAIKDQIPLSNEHLEMIESYASQAKEMEKEQIIEAHGNKQKTKSNPGSIVTFGYTYTGEMYYNEKFKGIKPII
jgi:hypothetical protein